MILSEPLDQPWGGLTKEQWLARRAQWGAREDQAFNVIWQAIEVCHMPARFCPTCGEVFYSRLHNPPCPICHLREKS